MQVCVVCGLRNSVGKERKSGFKCPKCVGKGSSRVHRYLACKAVEYKEVFLRGGFGHSQPVEWEDSNGKMVLGQVSLDNVEEKWTDPSTENIPVMSDAGDFSEVPAARVYPLVKTEVVFRDGKRGSHCIHLEACDGYIKQSVSFKDTSEKEASAEVRKISYTWEGNATLSFPELPITKAKVWLPMTRQGWRSHKAVVWHIRQLATAAGIEHDLPLNPPQPRFASAEFQA